MPPAHRRILVRASHQRLPLVRGNSQAEERPAAAVGALTGELGHAICQRHEIQDLQRRMRVEIKVKTP